jgi:predicted RNA-binding protein YlxR (DUF448 family)
VRSEPVRTCVGCRQRDTSSNLVRLVLDRAASPPRVVLDRRARLAGRGAWVHCDERCAQRVLRPGNLARAFRYKGAVETRALEGLGAGPAAGPTDGADADGAQPRS